jgi:hypothetical protein
MRTRFPGCSPKAHQSPPVPRSSKSFTYLLHQPEDYPVSAWSLKSQVISWRTERTGLNLSLSAIQGSFFMPPRIHKKKDCNFKETVWTKFVAALQNRDTAKEPYLTERANEETACYFGEYLLSFATSVGNLRIMHKLKTSFPFDHQAFEPPCIVRAFNTPRVMDISR